MKFYVINGPNINMLGIREPDIYGRGSYAELKSLISEYSRELGVVAEIYQSNHEGELVDIIQSALGRADGIIINPAAYTHTSIAILDALKAVALPAVEVHLTDISAREPFRHISYTGMACIKSISGLGFEGYREAIRVLKHYIKHGGVNE